MVRTVAAFFVATVVLVASTPDAGARVLHGRIVAGASIESPPSLSVAVDTWLCGKDGEIGDPRLVIAEDRGLADVVVTVRNVSDPPPYRAVEQPTIVQEGCVFTPHVVVVAPGQELEIVNSDRVLHTFRTTGERNRNINKAQVGGKRDTVKFDEPEILVLECDVHYWMSAVVVVAPHSLVAVSDDHGRFTIEGLDPGRYELELWHQRLGRKTVSAVIEGERGDFKFTWEK